MIDFRYHLVSLVAVFLALAIGIVMGAGPLRETLGEQLTEQVEQLRADRDTMRSENQKLSSENSDLAQYISATADDLVAGTLEEHSVVIVSDHESLDESTRSIETQINAAGGTVTNQVRVDPSVWDPARDSEREDVLASVRSNWPAVAPEGEGTSRQIGELIVQMSAASSELTDDERTEIAKTLSDAGFVQLSEPTLVGADAIVFANASQDQYAVKSDSADEAASRSSYGNAFLDGVVRASAERMEATVVTSANVSPQASEGVVRTVRGSNDLPEVSTVDGLSRAGSPTVVALALATTLLGDSGHFGVATDASEPAPSAQHIRERLAAEGNDSAPSDAAPSDGGQQ